MRIFPLITVLVLAACATTQLEWPEISPNFAKLDPGRKLIYERLAAARDLESGDSAHEKILDAVRSLHGAAAIESTSSKLRRVARIDGTNAIVIFDVSTDRPGFFEHALLVYPVALVGGRWEVVRSYKLVQSQVVAKSTTRTKSAERDAQKSSSALRS